LALDVQIMFLDEVHQKKVTEDVAILRSEVVFGEVGTVGVLEVCQNLFFVTDTIHLVALIDFLWNFA